jgi:hypothetical protein
MLQQLLQCMHTQTSFRAYELAGLLDALSRKLMQGVHINHSSSQSSHRLLLLLFFFKSAMSDRAPKLSYFPQCGALIAGCALLE